MVVVMCVLDLRFGVRPLSGGSALLGFDAPLALSQLRLGQLDASGCVLTGLIFLLLYRRGFSLRCLAFAVAVLII